MFYSVLLFLLLWYSNYYRYYCLLLFCFIYYYYFLNIYIYILVYYHHPQVLPEVRYSTWKILSGWGSPLSTQRQIRFHLFPHWFCFSIFFIYVQSSFGYCMIFVWSIKWYNIYKMIQHDIYIYIYLHNIYLYMVYIFT